MLRKDKNDEDHYYQYDDSDFNDYGLDRDFDKIKPQKAKIKVSRISKALVISLVFIGLAFVSCVRSCSPKSSKDVEKELEKKYGKSFSYVGEDKEYGTTYLDEGNNERRGSDTTIYYYKDDEGNEFEVRCNENGFFGNDFYYMDNYEAAYFNAHAGEFLSDFEKAGIETKYNMTKAIYFNIESYEQLEGLTDEDKKLRQKLSETFTKKDSYIHSEPNMSNAVLMFCHEDIMITYNCFDIDDVKEDYIDHVRKGEIKEKLPE